MSQEQERGIWANLAIIVLALGQWPLSTYIAADVWSMFAVPLGGPTVSWASAMGLSCIVGVWSVGTAREATEDDKKHPLRRFLAHTVARLAVWGAAWLVWWLR